MVNEYIIILFGYKKPPPSNSKIRNKMSIVAVTK